MIRKISAFTYVASLSVLFVAVCASALTVHDVVKPYERPDYIPAASDVSIRSLNFRPMDKDDDHNTIQAVKDFHATRLEWVYLRFNEEEKKLIRKVKDMGCVFGASGEPGTGVKVELAAGRDYIANALLSYHGQPRYNVHSKDWVMPIYPGCVNNPVYKRNNLEYYVKNVQWGADVLQRDGASNQYHYARVGEGCYCKYCMKEFPKYLEDNISETKLKELGIDNVKSFDYKKWLADNDFVKDDGRIEHINNPLFMVFADFQQQSNTQFFKDLRTAVNIHALRRVPFSHNNTSWQHWEYDFNLVFDFALSEIVMQASTPTHIYDRACKARRLGKVQVFGTPKSMGKNYTQTELNPLKRQVIATAYASGGLARVPWDMFEDTKDGAGRYFGSPEHFADIYGFVRSIAPLLEAYEDAGGFGPGIEENRYPQEAPLKISADAEKVYAFIRAIPGDKDAPVVIHLVDWNEDKKPFAVSLNSKSFFTSGTLSLELYQPVKYYRRIHERAWQRAQEMLGEDEKLSPKHAKAYYELSQKTELKPVTGDGVMKVTIPPINPWAVLVVSKL